MTRQGFECYKMYLALQRHFSTKYDFHKYNGKVNVSSNAYSNRNDKYSFEKLAKILPAEERLDFFISHFIVDPKMWIRNMSKQHYDNYKSTIKNFPKRFKEDMELISQYDPSELMSVGNNIPLIHKLVIDKKVLVETIITIDNFWSFIDKHEEEVKVPFLFPDHIAMVKNYRPFFNQHVTPIHKDIMKNALIG